MDEWTGREFQDKDSAKEPDLPPDGATDAFADSGFLARLRDREPGALHELTKAYLPQVYRAARGAGLDVHSAEDVTQNTFVTFIEKIDSFAGRSHVRTWLFGILYRKISETRRSIGRQSGHEDIDEVMESRFGSDGKWAAPPRATDQRTYNEEIRRHLDACMEGLTTDQRLAFVLREVEGLTSEEICAALDITRTNLGVLLYRGRNSLRECLEGRDITGS